MQSIFEILSLIGSPDKISNGKSLSKGSLICFISGMEGRRKLKFGEVSLQTCQNFRE